MVTEAHEVNPRRIKRVHLPQSTMRDQTSQECHGCGEVVSGRCRGALESYHASALVQAAQERWGEEVAR
jgi:hypothetical protein